MPKLDHDTIELLLFAITAICILFQTIMLSAVFFGVRKGMKALTDQVEEVRGSVMPVIDHARGFMERITPKVEATANNVAEMSQTIKDNATKVTTSATEIAQRVNAQTSRVDTMITAALDVVDHAVVFVADTVNKPVRQLSGLLASVKAIVEVLGAPQPPHRHPPPPQHDPRVADETESVI